MSKTREVNAEILPPNPIRVETALSRNPLHRLAKHGDIAIDIQERDESGEISTRWEVTHNSKHGQPGPMAYKLDTLIINRRIEEAARPIPKIIRLGSLREITEKLGKSTHATDSIKKALRQNAGSLISTKTRYRRADGSERSLEAEFTRYSVVFTGEELPNGRRADAVYIILNDIYMHVISGAQTRPLDYDYLKILTPAAQRFYELLSYQMYAAIKNDRSRAKLTYSELCRYAPLTRHMEWDRVRSQLTKIHNPHRKSGYIGTIDFQDATDTDGMPDWIIFYQPGSKAHAEFRAFTKRGGPVTLEVEPFSDYPLTILPSFEPTSLQAALIGHGITPAVAADLLRQHGEDKVSLQVEHLEWLNEKKPGKVAEPGGWLRTAITNGITLPKGFVPKAERERQAVAKRQKEEERAATRLAQQKTAERERAEDAAIDAYWNALTPVQQAELDNAATAQADPQTLALEKGPLKRMGQWIRRKTYIRHLLVTRGEIAASE